MRPSCELSRSSTTRVASRAASSSPCIPSRVPRATVAGERRVEPCQDLLQPLLRPPLILPRLRIGDDVEREQPALDAQLRLHRRGWARGPGRRRMVLRVWAKTTVPTVRSARPSAAKVRFIWSRIVAGYPGGLSPGVHGVILHHAVLAVVLHAPRQALAVVVVIGDPPPLRPRGVEALLQHTVAIAICDPVVDSPRSAVRSEVEDLLVGPPRPWSRAACARGTAPRGIAARGPRAARPGRLRSRRPPAPRRRDEPRLSRRRRPCARPARRRSGMGFPRDRGGSRA